MNRELSETIPPEERRLVRLIDLDTRGLALRLPGGAELLLTAQDVLRFLVREGKASREEAVLFLAYCATRGLNPLEDDIYLVKYDETEPARIILGRHGYLKLAHRQPTYLYHTSGVLIRTKEGKVEARDGSFYEKDKETLVGGWAEVYREGKPPYSKRVLLEEFTLRTRDGRPRRMWGTMPATMIEKVSVVQALREAFPDMGLNVVMPEEELEPEDIEARERRHFWAAARNLGLSDQEIHQALGIASVKDWLAQGKTWAQALDRIREVKLQGKEAPEPPPPLESRAQEAQVVEGQVIEERPSQILPQFKDFNEASPWLYERYKRVPAWANYGTPGMDVNQKAALVVKEWGSPPAQP